MNKPICFLDRLRDGILRWISSGAISQPEPWSISMPDSQGIKAKDAVRVVKHVAVCQPFELM